MASMRLRLRPLAGRYIVVEITPSLFNEAMRLANTHALRAYDAVQLAAALEINHLEQDAGFAPLTLVSADHALNIAAVAEGLSVDDPNLHPCPPFAMRQPAPGETRSETGSDSEKRGCVGQETDAEVTDVANIVDRRRLSSGRAVGVLLVCHRGSWVVGRYHAMDYR